MENLLPVNRIYWGYSVNSKKASWFIFKSMRVSGLFCIFSYSSENEA